MHPRRPRTTTNVQRRARMIALVATLATITAAALSFVVAAHGDRSTRAVPRDVAERAAVRTRAAATAAASTAATPSADSSGACRKTAPTFAQGRACRRADGLFVLPGADGRSITTHGPDLVDALHAPSRRLARTARVAGQPSSAICSSPLRTRHVQLVYLLPADHAAGRGDRFAQQIEPMRAAFDEAAAIVDRRASELAPGTRRRIRVACDGNGLASVQRVVLPRTAATYRSTTAGFAAMYSDLTKLGLIGTNPAFDRAYVPAVRRVVAYYDAEFVPGVVGQGSMYLTGKLIADTSNGLPASHPLLSTTTRNINNNPPEDSFAVQYASTYDGVPDPPFATGLLHELTHTMGAVQDEPPTSSTRGHCNDGLDVMCYDDRTAPGQSFSYNDVVCPAAATPATEGDLRFDCNGDTYFHPAPPAGSPLAQPRMWQLGLTANETLSADTTTDPAPAAVTQLRATGTGTSITLTWAAVPGDARRTYEVLVTRPGQPPEVHDTLGRRTFQPLLRPRTTYTLAVRAVDRNGDVGVAASISRRTGADTTAPTAPTSSKRIATTRTSVRLRFAASIDNVAVRSYRVERLVAGRWQLLRSVPARAVRGVVTTPVISGLSPRTAYSLRIRARDAAGRTSPPSTRIRFTTPR